MGGYDPAVGRPNISAWLDRVRKDTQPHYNDVAGIVTKVVKKFGGVPPADISKL